MILQSTFLDSNCTLNLIMKSLFLMIFIARESYNLKFWLGECLKKCFKAPKKWSDPSVDFHPTSHIVVRYLQGRQILHNHVLGSEKGGGDFPKLPSFGTHLMRCRVGTKTNVIEPPPCILCRIFYVEQAHHLLELVYLLTTFIVRTYNALISVLKYGASS